MDKEREKYTERESGRYIDIMTLHLLVLSVYKKPRNTTQWFFFCLFFFPFWTQHASLPYFRLMINAEFNCDHSAHRIFHVTCVPIRDYFVRVFLFIYFLYIAQGVHHDSNTCAESSKASVTNAYTAIGVLTHGVSLHPLGSIQATPIGV